MSLTRIFLFLLALALVAPGAAQVVPRKSPEFTIQTPSGQQILLSQYRGKIVLVEFLLTTCPTCQHTSQLMNRLFEEFGARGFQPLGIAIDDKAASLLPAYVQKFDLRYPVGFAPRDRAIEYLQHSVVQRFSVPRLVLIDRAGVIQRQVGSDPSFFANEEKILRGWIEELLKQAPAPKQPKR
jgi:peroxiredoxin